jgi:hypothetical protein
MRRRAVIRDRLDKTAPKPAAVWRPALARARAGPASLSRHRVSRHTLSSQKNSSCVVDPDVLMRRHAGCSVVIGRAVPTAQSPLARRVASVPAACLNATRAQPSTPNHARSYAAAPALGQAGAIISGSRRYER